MAATIHCIAAGALKGAVIGGVVSAITSGTSASISHRVTTGSWKGEGTAARDGAADAFPGGVISGVFCGGSTGNACFIAGREVLTVSGYKAIESILPGDKVWSEDPETGEKAWKDVV